MVRKKQDEKPPYDEKSTIKTINQKEERLYSCILELRCPHERCHRYFGLDISRAKTIKNPRDALKDVTKDIECDTKIMNQIKTLTESYSFILALRCPHCKKRMGLDVSNASTVTNY